MTNRLQLQLNQVQNAADEAHAGVPVVDANQLLGKRGVVAIMHGRDEYRLTRTRQNKLLLTKCHDGLSQELSS